MDMILHRHATAVKHEVTVRRGDSIPLAAMLGYAPTGQDCPVAGAVIRPGVSDYKSMWQVGSSHHTTKGRAIIPALSFPEV